MGMETKNGGASKSLVGLRSLHPSTSGNPGRARRIERPRVPQSDPAQSIGDDGDPGTGATKPSTEAATKTDTNGVGQVTHPEAVTVRINPRCVACGSDKLRVVTTRRSDSHMEIKPGVWRRPRIQFCDCKACGAKNQKVLAY